MNGSWKESEGTVRLPEEVSETFGMYVDWLYSGKIFCEEKDDEHLPGTEVVNSCGLTRLTHLYLLGDKLQDRKLRNAIVDAMIKRVVATNRFPTGEACKLYAGTTTSSIMRRLLVDFYVWVGQPDWLEEESEPGARGDITDASKQFFIDIAMGLMKHDRFGKDKVAIRPWIKGRCQYHEHEGEPRCNEAVSNDE